MAAFAAVVAVIFVSSAIVYDRLRVIETATSWRVHTAQVLETLQMAMDAMLDQETGMRGYMVSGNEISLEPYQRGGQRLHRGDADIKRPHRRQSCSARPAR
jgi:CHASE3 domain sensor protein